MTKSDEKVSYFLNKYLGKIKSIYKPDELWLWGSRAYGKPDEYSDIDLIVVSEKFSDVKFTKRMYKFIDSIGLLNDRTAETVDVLCYTPAEFLKKKGQVSIINEAIRKGIRII
jgi:predicted nucleotidyltransferase